MKSNIFFKNFFIFLFIFFAWSFKANFYDNKIIYFDSAYSHNIEYGLKLEDDKDIPEQAISDTAKDVLNILKFIPGLGIIIQPISYLVELGFNSFGDDDFKNMEDFSTEKFFSVISTIGDAVNPTPTEGKSSIAIQRVFGSNAYCQQQKVYIEEEEYLSKAQSAPYGGYAMFPIYPIESYIGDDGQCSFGENNNILKDKFIKINNNDSAKTKCSFAFSASNEQCILDLNVPMLSLYYAESIIVDGICVASTAKNAAKAATKAKKVTNALKAVAKITSGIAKGVSGVFFDSKLSIDPVSLMALFNVEMSIEFFTGLVTDLITMNIPCLISRVVGMQTVFYANQSIIAGVSASNYNKALEAVPEFKFCGYNWLSYTKTSDKKYYIRGMYDKSHFKSVSDCINDKNCSLNNSYACNEEYCKGVNNNDRDIRNKIYREYIYGGKEYEANIVENSITDIDDNRMAAIDYLADYCIDPRIPEHKGFSNILQRYYMKGNEKGNFACNRFFYDGDSGCVLPKIAGRETIISDEDAVKFGSNDIINYNNKEYYIIRKDNDEMFIKYNTKCQEAFIEARKCCKFRSRHFVCLEKKNTDKNTFCFSNVIKGYMDENSGGMSLFSYLSNKNDDLDKPTCELDGFKFEAGKKKGTNHVCVFSTGLCPYNFKLNAGLNYRASYCDSVFSDANDEDSNKMEKTINHYNAGKCKNGLFSGNTRQQYKDLYGNELVGLSAFTFEKVRNDMINYNNNDFKTIYDFDAVNLNNLSPDAGKYFNNNKQNIVNYGYVKYTDKNDSNSSSTIIYDLPIEIANQAKTSAYGQVKNFCQYRAHCVEVDKEVEYNDDYINEPLFLDSSCSGKTNNSRNILKSKGSGFSRQFSAPIVECIFESLRNLVNGISGYSLCEVGYSLNSNGYCGNDSAEIVKTQINNSNTAFFEGRYKKINGTYIVKSRELPSSMNPFLKIQKYLINTIKAALTLFLVVYFWKRAITNPAWDFFKFDKMPKMTLIAFQMTVVLWLIFYNGWQKEAYSYLVNFATSSYSFVTKMFVKNVQNSKNVVLNYDSINSTDNKIIKVIKEDSILKTKSDFELCYKYNLSKEVRFSERNLITKRCVANNYLPTYNSEMVIKKKVNQIFDNNRFIISNNQEIEQLLYFIDKYNSTSKDKLILTLKLSDNNWTNDLTGGLNSNSVGYKGIWNKNYDGCYFDMTEYPDGKEYIAIFDTLDCKMMRYLGYSVNNMAPNMLLYGAIMLLPKYFFRDGIVTKILSGIGTIIFGIIIAFVLLIFNFVVKALYIFLSSFFTLSILIFISPIVLPLMFLERTKPIYENWLKNVMDSIVKPIFNIAFLVIYINLMDIILFKDVLFKKHSNLGRDAGLICPENSFSFICFINGTPIFSQIKAIFDYGLLNLAANILISVLMFVLADSILEDLNKMAGSIFSFGGKVNDLNSDKNTNSMSSKDIIKKSKEAGTNIQEFSRDVIGTAPVAAVSIAARKMGEAGNKMSANIEKENTRREKLGKKPVAKSTVGFANFLKKTSSGIHNFETIAARGDIEFGKFKNSFKEGINLLVGKKSQMVKGLTEFGKMLTGNYKNSNTRIKEANDRLTKLTNKADSSKAKLDDLRNKNTSQKDIMKAQRRDININSELLKAKQELNSINNKINEKKAKKIKITEIDKNGNEIVREINRDGNYKADFSGLSFTTKSPLYKIDPKKVFVDDSSIIDNKFEDIQNKDSSEIINNTNNEEDNNVNYNEANSPLDDLNNGIIADNYEQTYDVDNPDELFEDGEQQDINKDSKDENDDQINSNSIDDDSDEADNSNDINKVDDTANNKSKK